MPSLSSRTLAAFALVALLLLPASPAEAAETSGADVALVPPGEVVRDDLYAGAVSVLISGRVEGDLVAAAAERVVIDGVVEGSVTVLTPELIVRGSVGGSVRAAGGTVTILGSVGKDLVASSLRVVLGPDSTIGGEVLLWSRRVDSRGTVEADFRGSASRIDLAGSVGGRVDVSVGRLRVVDNLTVDGDLAYRSRQEAEGLGQAEVTGTVVQRTELPPNIRLRALGLLGRLLAIVFVAIAAVTVVWSWPEETQRAARRVWSPRSWLLGAALFMSPVLVLGLGWLVLWLAPPAAGLPLVLVLLPVFLATLGAIAVAALAAAVPVATAFGSALFRALGPYGATLGGSLILGAAWMLPWVGLLVPIVTLPLGLGAWLRSRGQPVEAND